MVLLILYLKIATLSFSQETEKNTYPPITDSVSVPYRFIIAHNNAYRDLKHYKAIDGLFQQEIHRKDISIQFYERSIVKLQAADSLNSIENRLLSKKSDEYEKLYLDFKHGYKRERRAKIVASIGLSLVAIAAGVAGFFIGRGTK